MTVVGKYLDNVQTWNLPRDLMAQRSISAKEILKDIKAGMTDLAHQDGAGRHVA